MIAAFLLPFPFRGTPAPYLWVYYRLLAMGDAPMAFILGADYLRPTGDWAEAGRWEMAPDHQARLGYRIPEPGSIDRHAHCILPQRLFTDLLASSRGNHIEAFRRLIRERLPDFEAAFADLLGALRPEAVLTWCNCASLSAAASRLGIPVLHLELGPLRAPAFRATAYLDFSGVNGGTEAEARFRANAGFRPEVTREALWRFFHTGAPLPEASAAFDTGVVFQVEDDSNLLAFSHGYDNQSLYARNRLLDPAGRLLLRPHPGSLFELKPVAGYEIDRSPDSLVFLRRCRQVATINSSVGLEALLLGMPVAVMGDCSYRHIADATDAREQVAMLAHYLFAYLVPEHLIFDADYLRFRLGRPGDDAIVHRHLCAYGVALPAHREGDSAACLSARLATPACDQGG